MNNKVSVSTIQITVQPYPPKPIRPISVEKNRDYLEKKCMVDPGNLSADKKSWIPPIVPLSILSVGGVLQYGKVYLDVWCDTEEVSNGLVVYVDGEQIPQPRVASGYKEVKDTITFNGENHANVTKPFGKVYPVITTYLPFFNEYHMECDPPVWDDQKQLFFSPIPCFGQMSIEYEAWVETFMVSYGNGDSMLDATVFEEMQASWMEDAPAEVVYPEVVVTIISQGQIKYFNFERQFDPYSGSLELNQQLETLKADIKGSSHEKLFVKYYAWPKAGDDGTVDKSDKSKATIIYTPYQTLNIDKKTGEITLEVDDYTHIPEEDIIATGLKSDELK